MGRQIRRLKHGDSSTKMRLDWTWYKQLSKYVIEAEHTYIIYMYIYTYHNIHVNIDIWLWDKSLDAHGWWVYYKNSKLWQFTASSKTVCQRCWGSSSLKWGAHFLGEMEGLFCLGLLSWPLQSHLCLWYTYIYIYINVCVCVICMHMYIYIYSIVIFHNSYNCI